MRCTTLLVLLFIGAGCAVEIDTAYGSIESPNYPKAYPDNENRTWILTARPGYQIVVYFTTFDLEDSYDEAQGGDCAYDFVELEHLGSRHRLCGRAKKRNRNAPRPYNKFRSEGSQMVINFVTDYSNEDPLPRGFQAHYYHDDKDECAEMSDLVKKTVEDWDELIYCDHFCVNVPGSYYCTCRHGYVLHPNLHTCPGNCRNVTLLADSGQVQTPEYPSKYSRLTDCAWNIEVRDGMSLNFAFSAQFDIEEHVNYTDCPYDYVKLLYADQEEKFCGSVAPHGGRTIMTNTRRARVEFHTDNSVEKSGFQLSYSTTRIRCNRSPSAPTNGTATHTQQRGYFELDDVVQFRCDTGFNLVGSQSIVCLSDGTWSGDVPVCEIKTCDDPEHLHVPHSTLEGASNAYKYLDVVTVTCNQWYETFSGTSKWICNENSEWVGKDGAANEVPKCTPVCGIKNHAERALFSQHISGGRDSRPNEWPWMAFVNLGSRPNIIATRHACGGSLIGPNHVLTAAHCVTTNGKIERPASQVFVWLGAHNRKKDHAGNTKARSFPVDSVHRHPRYNHTNWDNDVAVLRLASTVVMDNDVRPICLPAPNTDAMDFEEGLVAGWGITERQFGGSIVLKDTELPTVNHTTCWQSFLDTVRDHNRTMPDHLRLTDNMFCAGVTIGSQTSTCQGDSGGPFMAQTSDNKYRVYGVVSWGISLEECGESLSYSVFADLHENMRHWVESQLV